MYSGVLRCRTPLKDLGGYCATDQPGPPTDGDSGTALHYRGIYTGSENLSMASTSGLTTGRPVPILSRMAPVFATTPKPEPERCDIVGCQNAAEPPYLRCKEHRASSEAWNSRWSGEKWDDLERSR